MTSCPPGYSQTELGCIAQDPSKFAHDIYGIGLGLIGSVALLAIIYGGYLILVSKGNPAALTKGKSYITYALIAIVLAVGGFALYQMTTVDIIKIPGFSN